MVNMACYHRRGRTPEVRVRLPFIDHRFVRLVSSRTGEVMLNLKMLGSGVIVWGQHYRPAEADVHLSEDGTTVAVSGVLRDCIGVVVTLGDVLDVQEGFAFEVGELPPDFDPSWRREA